MRNAGMIIGITLFIMVMIVMAWSFGMQLYRDYRKDKQRELEFLNRKQEFKETGKNPTRK